jgi:D-tyrosyl-tRNA(Tyr) deacylase
MNLGLDEVEGDLLVVSQFTLYGDASRGRRPSFTGAAPPEHAEALYLEVAERLRQTGVAPVRTGTFGAHMRIRLLNDGPVTLILDTGS